MFIIDTNFVFLIKEARKLYDAKVENDQLVNEIHALKTEIYELRKLIPEGILINRESRDKPARQGRQLR